jgi:hypothetical protein
MKTEVAKALKGIDNPVARKILYNMLKNETLLKKFWKYTGDLQTRIH